MPDVAPSNKPIKKRRGLWWKIPVYGLVLLFIAFGVFRIVVHQWVQLQIIGIRDRTLPASPKEHEAWYAYPDGPNAADVYQQAFDAFVGDEDFEQTLPIFGDRETLPDPGEQMPEDLTERVAYYLDQNAEALAKLDEAAGIDSCRYPIDLTQGFNVELTHFNDIRRAAQIRILESAHYENRGEHDLAVGASLKILSLARSLEDEPVMLSMLVQYSLQEQAYDQIERLIKVGAMSEKTLAMLPNQIGRFDTPEILHRAFIGERCWGLGVFSDHTNDGLLFDAMRFSGLMDLDQAHYLQMMHDLVEYSRSPVWPIPDRFDVYDRPPRLYPISGIMTIAFGACTKTHFELAAKRQVTLVAIAVERYRQQHGYFPNRIDDLVPEYLTELPADTIDYQMVHYRTVDGGAVVYSFGTDGIDNNGRPYTEDGYGAGRGSDISFIFGPTAQELWPLSEEEEGGQAGGFDDLAIYGYEDPDSDEAYEIYLKKLEGEGFPALKTQKERDLEEEQRRASEFDFNFEEYDDPMIADDQDGDETSEP
jgi:hypothetical protein